MSLIFNQKFIEIEQLLKGKIDGNSFSESDLIAIDIIRSWISGCETFQISTSGSTGIPSTINLTRQQLKYSAQTSLKLIDPNGLYKNALLCINPAYIGGIMVIIRALLADLDLHIIAPTTKLNEALNEPTYDLVSLVPIQIRDILNTDPLLFKKFKTILIGGGTLKPHEIEILSAIEDVTFYQTYGMTETASHIALKNISKNEQYYTTIGDAKIAVDQRNCLKISGTVTNNQWIQTNDMVNILSENSFVWLGRGDFIINSGGIKVNPEQVENQLSDQIKNQFFITSVPDHRLGEKVVLVIEGSQTIPINLEVLDKYHRPKEIILLPEFVYTQSGKINRIKTKALIS